ncbi:HAMP domain-containing sensor histidine kinase [Fictibacillus sp. b24]|uniref:sensor histidine kinase n=1 Tax=Fictibacillus sp. b24 TaxID=3055863 RepID=UPI0025A28103|nr:HAMP domain-containing sensor histidine kinase [Fictibacillus sp. b24]MDM5317063.1 HAMP domain-containing sensor histidine kinase [Fictibacillus sp. b24]
MANKKRTTLLRYWTTRYLFTLFIGLLILGVFTLWWIRHTTLENRLTLMEYVAAETADRIASTDRNKDYNLFNKKLDDRAKVLQMDRPPEFFITDMDGNVLNSKPLHKGLLPKDHQFHNLQKIPSDVLENKKTVQKLQINEIRVYAVKKPIVYDNNQAGWVFVMQNASELTDVEQEYRLPIILLIGLGLLGWIVIYLLTKKILKPIQNVAFAASQIRDGNYDIHLNREDAKEKEIHELLASFEEMTNRLTQLETLRAELLAGVTHDLKTPVTSISGLVQAVKDGIVSGNERDEFLEITMKEIHRLQRMIEDLLDYNSLSAGAFSIRLEESNMNELLREIVHHWKVTQNEDFDINVDVPEEIVSRETDPLRLQQILINLLNNAYHALGKDGSISVSLSKKAIEVFDTGSGIPEEEQPYIFERFFRGEKKKLKIRGLGLGLPFSRMLAKALGADLILKSSSPRGTTFSIVWKK